MIYAIVGIISAAVSVWHLNQESTAQSRFTVVDMLLTFMVVALLWPMMLPLTLWSIRSAYVNNKAKAFTKPNR